MRQPSAAMIKNARRGRNVLELQEKPREGSVRRQIYDLFMENPGKPVRLKDHQVFNRSNPGAEVMFLRDIYGLDVRSVGGGWYICAGETMANGVYVDYVGAEGVDFAAISRLKKRKETVVEPKEPIIRRRRNKEDWGVLIRSIRELHAQGYDVGTIAALLDAGKGTVYRILKELKDVESWRE